MSPPIATSRMATIMPNSRKKVRVGLNHSAPPAELPLVRHLIRARRAGALAIAATAGLLAVAGPALADVTVSPPTAPQTSGANLTFHVTNTGASAITRLMLTVPDDTPIAEVYPLSNADWAPDITQQKLNTPLNTIHGGTPVTEVTKNITWIALPGRAIAPGKSADLAVSLGPLPTLSQMHFDVTPTYADGKAGPAVPPVVLKLTPATPEEVAAAHAGHDAAQPEAAAGGTDPDSALFAQTVSAAEHGPSIWSIGGWIIAALLGLGLVWAYLRNRHRSEPAEDDETEETEEPASEDDDGSKEPVGAGTAARKASGWRYQDGPE
jgi:Domain of unkown function (DUF1775)